MQSGSLHYTDHKWRHINFKSRDILHTLYIYVYIYNVYSITILLCNQLKIFGFRAFRRRRDWETNVQNPHLILKTMHLLAQFMNVYQIKTIFSRFLMDPIPIVTDCD